MITSLGKIPTFKELTDKLPNDDISHEEFAAGTKRMNELVEKTRDEYIIRMDYAKRSAAQVWIH